MRDLSLSAQDSKTYRLSQQGWQQYRLRLFRRFGLVALLIGSASLIYCLTALNGQWYQWLVFLLILIGGSGGLLLQFRHEQASWLSLELRLGRNFITRGHPEGPEIHVMRHEIIKIQEYKFGLLITTEKKSQPLIVPAELDPADFQEIKQALSKWQSIELKFKK